MANSKPEVRFMGAFLMAVGFMMAGLCGTCTLAYDISTVRDVLRSPEGGYLTVVVPFMLIFGVLPTVVGLVLLRAGYRRYRGP